MPNKLSSLATSVSEDKPLDLNSVLTASDGWNRDSHPLKKGDFGVFEIVLPPNEHGHVAIPHNSKIKVSRHCHIQMFVC